MNSFLKNQKFPRVLFLLPIAHLSSIGISFGGTGAECDNNSTSKRTAAFGGTVGENPNDPRNK